MVDLEVTLRSSLGGRYDIEEEVGSGGMSIVYRAHDLKHNRTVAIKVLRPELSEQIGADRFQREIEVVAGLTHPYILPRVWRENTAGIMDPQDSTRSIDMHGMYSTLQTLRALGPLGESGPDVALRFDRLRRAWRDAPLSDRDRVALRAATMSFVGPALVHSPDEWDAWFSGWDQYGFEVPAVWKGILAAAESPPDLSEARARLDEALQELERVADDRSVRPLDLYLPLVLAQRTETEVVQAELRLRFAPCALRLDNFGPAWAMWGSLGVNE